MTQTPKNQPITGLHCNTKPPAPRPDFPLNDTETTSPCPILTMLSARTGSEKYQLCKPLVWLGRDSNPRHSTGDTSEFIGQVTTFCLGSKGAGFVYGCNVLAYLAKLRWPISVRYSLFLRPFLISLYYLWRWATQNFSYICLIHKQCDTKHCQTKMTYLCVLLIIPEILPHFAILLLELGHVEL